MIQAEKKKIHFAQLLPILALVLIGLSGGTYAFYKSDIAQSLGINTAGYEVTLVENSDPGWGKREINIKNNGTYPVLIRISYNEIWSKVINEEEIIYNNLLNDETAVTKEWTDEFLNNFTLHDGWYYYNKTLNAGASIQVLRAIQLKEYDSSWDYDYRTLDYELAWNYESVQANNNVSLKIWGINSTVEGSSVRWEF